MRTPIAKLGVYAGWVPDTTDIAPRPSSLNTMTTRRRPFPVIFGCRDRNQGPERDQKFESADESVPAASRRCCRSNRRNRNPPQKCSAMSESGQTEKVPHRHGHGRLTSNNGNIWRQAGTAVPCHERTKCPCVRGPVLWVGGPQWRGSGQRQDPGDAVIYGAGAFCPGDPSVQWKQLA